MLDPRELLTVAQAAKRTVLSEAALRARIDRGELTVVRLGGHLFLTEEELRTKLGKLYQSSPATTPKQ